MTEKILEDRELRFNLIKKLSMKHPFIITLKANTPGDDKNQYSSYFLIKLFNTYFNSNIKFNSRRLHEGHDGPFYVYTIDEVNTLNMKDRLVEIEENHPLGRLIDLDYYINGVMVSRKDLNVLRRTCLLCENDAIVCMRNQAHTYNDLLAFIDSSILSYLKKQVDLIIDSSILNELNLTDKFGLVTPLSSGSHKDMDYDLMFKSKDIIRPYLVGIFLLGFNFPDNDSLFKKAQHLGIEAEKKMFELTNHVNTYKGLIYILGYVLLSLGIVIKKNKSTDEIYDLIKHFSSEVFSDLSTHKETAGIRAYIDHQITGIRGEVFNGLPSLRKAILHFQDIDVFSQTHQHAILLFLMRNTEDTVLLKRAGSLEKYQQINKLLKDINPYDSSDIKGFTKFCINHNLSFGGSADLFIVFHFIALFHKLIF